MLHLSSQLLQTVQDFTHVSIVIEVIGREEACLRHSVVLAGFQKYLYVLHLCVRESYSKLQNPMVKIVLSKI